MAAVAGTRRDHCSQNTGLRVQRAFFWSRGGLQSRGRGTGGICLPLPSRQEYPTGPPLPTHPALCEAGQREETERMGDQQEAALRARRKMAGGGRSFTFASFFLKFSAKDTSVDFRERGRGSETDRRTEEHPCEKQIGCLLATPQHPRVCALTRDRTQSR